MPDVSINYLAVVVAALAAMVLGFAWYSPALFSRMWVKEMGKTEEDFKQGAGAGYAWAAVAALVTAYVLSHFVDYANAVTLADGAKTGLWAGLGLVATAMFTTNLFSGSSTKLWLINAGYQVVNLVIMGMILAVWQ